jgi:DNA polymerase-3 subunit beta
VKLLRFEVSQKLLLTALNYITPTISTKAVIPILSGIKLQVNAIGLTLTTANTGMMMQYEIPYDNECLIVHNNGSIVIPSRYLVDIIRNMPSGLIKFKINTAFNICIQSEKAIYNLNGMNPDEYPQLVKYEHCSRLILSNYHLKQLIKKVAFATSSSEARPALTGVSYALNKDHLRFVASDGIRLSSQTTNKFISDQLDKVISVIIPGKHLFDFSKTLIDDQSTTYITIENTTITFKNNNLTMQSSLIEGTYPTIDRIVPETFNSEIVVVTREFLHALERVALLSGESNIVCLVINSVQSIELSSKTAEIGDVFEEIQLEELIGEQISISFNGKYMMDIIRAIDSEKTRIKLTDKWKPIVVQPIDIPESLFLLTPIRTSIV